MKNLYGITKVQIEIIEVSGQDAKAVNDFLLVHDGNIIDVQVIGMNYGLCKFIITYREEM